MIKTTHILLFISVLGVIFFNYEIKKNYHNIKDGSGIYLLHQYMEVKIMKLLMTIQTAHHKLLGELQDLKLRENGLTLVQKFLELLEYMVIKDHLLRNY